MFDCETDSLLRTFTDSAFREGFRIYSPPDGDYLLIGGYGGPLIWDVRTDQAMSQLSNDVLYGVFVPRKNMLIGLGWGKTFLYTVPTGQLINQYDVELLHGVLVLGNTRLVGLTVGSGGNLTTTLKFSLETGKIEDTISLDLEGERGLGSTTMISLRHRMVRGSTVVNISDSRSDALCYDLTGDSVRFLAGTVGASMCAVSPDGSELWVARFGTSTGRMLICNAETGAFISEFSTDDFGIWPASDIAFCEEFGKVYLQSSKGAPILVVDGASHAIVGKLAHNPGQPYESIVTMKTSY